MEKTDKYPWLKSKGYLHLTPQLDVLRKKVELISKITNADFVAKYAFFPLIHSAIKERKYKKIPVNEFQFGKSKRGHSYRENGKTKAQAKSRPLHYSSHTDALIFGYYAHLLLEKYNCEISKKLKLSESIIAYRKIPLDDEKNKSTIHFAKEVFDEIKLRADPDCAVLKYDIKSFFNRMDHKLLLKAWIDLLGEKDKLPPAHYNVYRNCVNFSYILKDDLRSIKYKGSGKRSGFDEKKLASIRTKYGVKSFYPTIKEFRESLKRGELRIHKFPFKNKNTGHPVGIPQGLPISSVLANLYLLEFDKFIIDEIVEKLNGFYRRYSDDIIIICKPDQREFIHNLVTNSIKDRMVEMSPDKTEKFIFKPISFDKKNFKLCSLKIEKGIEKIRHPFTYLGFEFYGYKTLIKSTNISKFYRRMILEVKRKAKRAIASSEKNPLITPAIFFNQLNKVYTKRDLNSTHIQKNISFLERNEKGEFSLVVKKVNRKFGSNYLRYIERVNNIIGGNLIKRQIRNRKKILNMAIKRHLFDKIRL